MPNMKEQKRIYRKKRIRRRVSGTTERPRLSVFRSLEHIYAQVIDDSTGNTLVAASSNDQSMRDEIETLRKNPPKPAEAKPAEEGGKKKGKKKEEKPEPVVTINQLIAAKIGEAIAERCKAKNISKVVFDRGGYRYHGRVKSLAEGARKAGLEF